MKRIAIVSNQDKDKGLKYLKILQDSIENNKMSFSMLSCFESENYSSCNANNDENYDIIICMGGDGTFLKAARKAYMKDIPIFGINLGNLGFLAEVDKNEINDAITKLVNREYIIENRMMIEAIIERDNKIIEKEIALNDITVSRGALSRIVHLETYINATFIDLFPGDGLIISSPTGSTGYSLSAGGPIVEPDTDLMIVTPICPHTLYTRSFITTGDRLVKVVIDEEIQTSAMVTIDGQKGYEVKGRDIINVQKSSKQLKLLKFKNRNFFKVLREKIYKRSSKE